MRLQPSYPATPLVGVGMDEFDNFVMDTLQPSASESDGVVFTAVRDCADSDEVDSQSHGKNRKSAVDYL